MAPLLVFVLVYAYGINGLGKGQRQAHGRPVKVALLQPDIGVQRKFDPSLVGLNTRINLQIYNEGCKKRPDLMVFPETTLPFPLFQEPERTLQFLKAVDRCGVPTVVGTYHWHKLQDGYYSSNRAYLLNAKGMTLSWYDKVHLVPFGEYVPLKSVLPFITQMVGFKNGFTPGNGTRPLPFARGNLGILICYEAIFPGIARDEVRQGAEILVNMSNDAWFGKTLAPYQHLAAAVFRAVENRRWLVRATNSGISAFVDPWGRVVERGGLFKREVLVHKVYPRKGLTVAARWGDWFAWLCLFLTGAMAATLFVKAGGEKTP